jgi:putative transposase
MARKRHTEEQIIGILKESEAGVKTPDICRQHGISDATFYKWKNKFAGMDVSEARRLRQLEDENRRLKQMVADQALDIQALKAVLEKKF